MIRHQSVVLIRADAGPQIGSGHVMRCHALAQALHKSGYAPQLLSRNLPGNLAKRWDDSGFLTHAMAPSLTEAQDAEVTHDLVQQMQAAAVIVDHYSLGAEWEARIQSLAVPVLAIDDLPDRTHVADLVLDQNLRQQVARGENGLASNVTSELFGPRYALLRPEFSQARQSLRRDYQQMRRVLINLGGFDPQGYTWSIVQALEQVLGDDIIRDVVVGIESAGLEALHGWAEANPQRKLLTIQAADMHQRMLQADLAIGAGGSSAWERCCLGLPTITVVLADNQQAVVQAAAQAGVLIDGGDLRKADWPQILIPAVHRYAGDAALRAEVGKTGMAAVDGAGANRVVEALTHIMRNKQK